MSQVGDFVFPGDKVDIENATISQFEGEKAKSVVVHLGSGLREEANGIFATKAGFLKFLKPTIWYIENEQKRYVPAIDDMVVGVITDKSGENYKVEIGSAALATLPGLGFQDATRRNRPILSSGSVVYGRVVVAHKDKEPEIVCVSERNKSDGFGELKEGCIVDVSLSLSRQLLQDGFILKTLAGYLSFEVAVGMNGRVWVRAATPLHTVLVMNVLQVCENVSPLQQRQLIRALVEKYIG
eukprot:GCRY01004418.1.p1 GENE.GCRY01004418.1~~GCRY01004418.1.p1  ORF type:complete len:258 (-),score=59.19 GCRY01004418.1:407-1126(-)